MKEIWHVKRLGSMIYLKFTRELQKIKSKSCAHEIKTSCVLCSRCDPYACICFIYVSQFLSVYITSTSVISVRSQFKTVLKFPAEVQIHLLELLFHLICCTDSHFLLIYWVSYDVFFVVFSEDFKNAEV